MDRFVRGCVLRGCVHGFVGCFFTFLFVPRYTGPALAQFGVPLVRIKTLRVYHPTMPKQKEDFRHELHTARGRSIHIIILLIHKEYPLSINASRIENRM